MTRLHLASPLLIRYARLDDVGGLHSSCFPADELAHVYDYLAWCLTGENRPTRLVAMQGGEVVGHVEVTWRHYRTPWAEVSSLVVTESLRGQGIGRRLVGAVERLARHWECNELRLQVRADAPDLIALYLKWGFVIQGQPIMRHLWMARPIPIYMTAKVEAAHGTEVPCQTNKFY